MTDLSTELFRLAQRLLVAAWAPPLGSTGRRRRGPDTAAPFKTPPLSGRVIAPKQGTGVLVFEISEVYFDNHGEFFYAWKEDDRTDLDAVYRTVSALALLAEASWRAGDPSVEEPLIETTPFVGRLRIPYSDTTGKGHVHLPPGKYLVGRPRTNLVYVTISPGKESLVNLVWKKWGVLGGG